MAVSEEVSSSHPTDLSPPATCTTAYLPQDMTSFENGPRGTGTTEFGVTD